MKKTSVAHIDQQIKYLQALKAGGDEYIAMTVITVEHLEMNWDYRSAFEAKVGEWHADDLQATTNKAWACIAGDVEARLGDKVDEYCLTEALDEAVANAIEDASSPFSKVLHEAKVARLIAEGYDRESAEVFLALDK